MPSLFLACRVPCAHGGRMMEPLGVATLESAAIAMCSDPTDAVLELEDGRLYPVGQELPGGIRTIFPHCPKVQGWHLSRGLTVEGFLTPEATK